MSISRILFSPIGLVFSTKNLYNLSEEDYKKTRTEFANKNPTLIQKTNLMTIGGFILSAFGGLISLFSEKAGKAFGVILTLIGLGGIGGGIFGAENSNQETVVSKADKTKDKKAKDKKTKDVDKSKNDDLSKLSIEELLSIVLNNVEGKKYTGEIRAKAAREIAKKELNEVKKIIEPLSNWFKNNVGKKGVSGVVKAVQQSIGEIIKKAKETGVLELFQKLTEVFKTSTT